MSDSFYALVIAGGRGERLRPLTDDRPKPMVEIDGKPIIGYQVDWMRSQGVTDVVFLTGYLGDRVEEYFGDGSNFGITAHYSTEDSPLGRGGALKKGLALVPKNVERVLVTNGDVITSQTIEPMLQLHLNAKAVGTVMLVPYRSQYGVVEFNDNDVVTRFIEKGNLPHWINAGVYLFDRQIEALLPDIGDHETTTFQRLAEQGKLSVLRSAMEWTSIDTPGDVIAVTQILRDGSLTFVS